MTAMPTHDLPDGRETAGNLIDFHAHLRRRVDLIAQDNDAPNPERSDRESFRFAEHGDGKPAKFSRHDLMLVGLFVAVAVMLGWLIFR
jgi:hypothetical protein